MVGTSLALSLAAKNFSPLPIIPGSKRPVQGCIWEQWQLQPMPASLITSYFDKGADLAIICGTSSQDLEVMDFDDPFRNRKLPHFHKWKALVDEYGYGDLLERLAIAQTPSGGFHVYYRCKAHVKSSEKLAMLDQPLFDAGGTNGKQVLIETKGQKGYILAAPTKGYQWVQGSLETVPEITSEERDFLLSCAKTFDLRKEHAKYPGVAPRIPSGYTSKEKRPGDIFNDRTNVQDLLEKYGWECIGRAGKRLAYRRPGKQEREISGTLTNDGTQIFYPFSTNAYPLEAQHSYDAFGLYAVMEHGGSFSDARKAVIEMFNLETPKIERPNATVKPQLTKEEISSGFQFEDIESFDYKAPTFGIFGQYLRSGQINLLDAPESIGKTKMVLKWAANMSKGWCDYYDVEIPQAKTLIFTTEDDGGDIHESFRECKGREGYLKIYREVVDMRGDEVKRLEETIRANNFGLVVFDPLLSYMHGVKDLNDARAVNEYLVPIRRVAMETGCCIINIRHFNKTVADVQRGRRAGGSIQFNSCHRSQVVIDWHTERPGVRVCTHERASNRVKKIEEPFGWSINSSGLMEWIFDNDMLNQGRGK